MSPQQQPDFFNLAGNVTSFSTSTFEFPGFGGHFGVIIRTKEEDQWAIGAIAGYLFGKTTKNPDSESKPDTVKIP